MHPHDAQKLAWELLRRHGLAGNSAAGGPSAAESGNGWRFRFDHARRRFGSCRYRQKLITLSRPLTLLNPEEEVRDTLLHEIAHALTPGDGHGAKWKRKCLEIGARPQRCYNDTRVLSPPRRPAPYLYGCPACGWWVDRRRLMATGRFVCARCKGALHYRDKSAGEAGELFTVRRIRGQGLVRVPHNGLRVVGS